MQCGMGWVLSRPVSAAGDREKTAAIRRAKKDDGISVVIQEVFAERWEEIVPMQYALN